MENWIQKYDTDMGTKQDEMETLETEFAEETIQLKELEEKLGVSSTAKGERVICSRWWLNTTIA